MTAACGTPLQLCLIRRRRMRRTFFRARGDFDGLVHDGVDTRAGDLSLWMRNYGRHGATIVPRWAGMGRRLDASAYRHDSSRGRLSPTCGQERTDDRPVDGCARRLAR
ncbi:hypothetical protein BN12_30029 [Nostocoides japonicum T1-X7]|uniref:Uncharacterized protein n=1 Tax=Nostocoides japonicum T1-X7 TaxID=1194083 RepID=A0A077LX67_9MICO|nr:hypothetical protein BN12_30029 [Tetrasphaera japonica T1-X7]